MKKVIRLEATKDSPISTLANFASLSTTCSIE